ncbi:hypothetical protein HPB52_008318 [Rhipicephalus sanguineus]|uniref:Uncharacterized protein n=1 Tax=Rhipicephalus sanguineus TaxID=34632 RepID=A0A9D4PQQ9_RHISA|nr:hypothetical protein HPB52_008318 [Rhipicephalus sanguineus]
MNCTAPFCGRCGTYGHDGKGCSLPCRRCGDPHATVACTIRRSYSEAASKDFPPLQPETPASDKGEVPPTPVPGPAQDQNTQDATPHPTPAAAPVSPDPASASTADHQVCVSRPPVITIERHAGTSLHSESPGRTDADDSVTSDTSHAASSSSANPPTIEESPSTDDGTVHIEDSDSSSSPGRGRSNWNAKELERLVQQLSLTDVYDRTYGGRHVYTWRRATSSSRLDRAYVSPGLMAFVCNVEVVSLPPTPVYISDHRPVALTLHLPAGTPAVQRPWRLDCRRQLGAVDVRHVHALRSSGMHAGRSSVRAARLLTRYAL